MVRDRPGFTVIQFIVAMTVVGLLLLGVFVLVAQRSWRDDQRKNDLARVYAMVERQAANNLGKYPKTEDADDLSSELRRQFEALRLRDPKSEKYYGLGSKFDSCQPSGSEADLGTGYISYARGTEVPFKLRICLEWGEYSIGR